MLWCINSVAHQFRFEDGELEDPVAPEIPSSVENPVTCIQVEALQN